MLCPDVWVPKGQPESESICKTKEPLFKIKFGPSDPSDLSGFMLRATDSVR